MRILNVRNGTTRRRALETLEYEIEWQIFTSFDEVDFIYIIIILFKTEVSRDSVDSQLTTYSNLKSL